jgi:concanavalin A-like lectin/glucanase superfamily protein
VHGDAVGEREPMRTVMKFLAIPAATAILAGAVAWIAPPAAARGAAGRVIARWLFDEGRGDVASDGVDGATNGRIVKAGWDKGRSGSALVFEDFSLKNYLKPDVREATRVVIPHNDRLNPAGAFTLSAVIYPTKDPVYYGGIFEKGRGYGSSYRLLLLRGLKVRAEAGASLVSATSASPISLNAWHEIEMVYDGSSLKLRIDGKEEGNAENVKGPFTNREEALVGERFSGKIDEVSLTTP